MSEHKPSIENVVTRRSWQSIKAVWGNNIPSTKRPGAAPDPILENLSDLRRLATKGARGRFSDEQATSVRSGVLAEALFLFHKCAHAHLAAQRLAKRGMHSWAMFNAYHSAFLGARGVLGLLGIAFPKFPSGQFVIDVYPSPPQKDQRKVAMGTYKFEAFDLVYFGEPISQEMTWAAFCRALRVSTIPCWSGPAYEEVRGLTEATPITRPRNAILYSGHFWPLSDLLVDGDDAAALSLMVGSLDHKESGFLLRLSFAMYFLFETLLTDLAKDSGPVEIEMSASRIASDPTSLDLFAYRAYLESMTSAAAS